MLKIAETYEQLSVRAVALMLLIAGATPWDRPEMF
jgi:hypothetical protein